MEQLTEQFIGVLFVQSFDVSSKVVRRTISDSRWLGHIHRGSNKSRSEYCTNSNNNLLYALAIQDRSGGELIAVAIPLRWKEFLYHVGRSFTGNSIRQAGLIAAADGITPFRPLWCWNRRGIRWFIEAKKSTLQEQVAGFSGRSPLGQFGKSTRKHGLTPLSSLTRCWLHRKKWWAFQETTAGSEDRAEDRLAGGARQTIQQREIVCGGRPLQNWSPCSRSSTLQYLKIKEEWPRFETWWIRSERNTEQNLSMPTWARHENSTDSVRNPQRLSNNWERSNWLNWQKFPRKYSVHHAPSAGQKDCYTALAV